jgi:multiple sugar transport system ATP-binding protein
VILGIRPEDIEDASLVPSANGSSLEVDVTLAEPLGAEVIAHFPLAMRSVAGPDDGTMALLTARLSPRSRAQTGAPLRIAVDVERLYFFEPETEAGIW